MAINDVLNCSGCQGSIYNSDSHCGGCEDLLAALEKLAAYVSTGYTPSEVKQVYDDMESKRCVLLPCPIGTTIYKITSHRCHEYCRKPYACNSYPYSSDCQAGAYVAESMFDIAMTEWIGKSVFLSEDDAKEALIVHA